MIDICYDAVEGSCFNLVTDFLKTFNVESRDNIGGFVVNILQNYTVALTIHQANNSFADDAKINPEADVVVLQNMRRMFTYWSAANPFFALIFE